MGNLYSPPSAGGTASDTVFHGYDSAGGTVIANTDTDITWDTEVRKDSVFTHSADSASITINETAYFLIMVDVECDVSDSTRSHADFKIQVNTGGGFADVPGSKAGTYHRDVNDGRDSATIIRLLSVTSGDIIKVIGVSDRATQITTEPDGCRITIMKVNAE